MSQNKSKYENQSRAFQESGFSSEPSSESIFSYEFERSLGFHLGEKFYLCIPQVKSLALNLKEKSAIGYENRIERNGVDGYVWLEKDIKDLILVGFKNQNVMYLVYIITNYGEDEIHVRQIWEDYNQTVLSGNYMLGKSEWDKIENPSYKDVITEGATATREYSDDFYDESGNSISKKGYFIKRPCLKTHLSDPKNVGMRYKDGRDEGYIASVSIDILTKSPYCDSPLTSMKSKLEYIFMDFKSVLNFPCLEGDEDL